MIKGKLRTINLLEYATKAKIKFSTNGIHGLNSQLTDKVCYVYTLAFLKYLENTKYVNPGQTIIVAGDLRENTDHILRVIQSAIENQGFKIEYTGKIPTPELCYYCLHKKMPGLMVTANYLPHDMNGMKFYHPDGKMLRTEEKFLITQSITLDESLFNKHDELFRPISNELNIIPFAYHLYVERYLQFFSADV